MTCHDSRRITKCPWKLERSPDVTEKTRVFKEHPHCKSRGNPRFPPQLEKNHEIFPLTVRWGPIPLHCLQSNSVFHIKHERRLDFLRELQKIPRNTVKSLEETWCHSCNPRELCVPQIVSRWGPILILPLERNPDVPLTPEALPFLTCWNSRRTPRSLL